MSSEAELAVSQKPITEFLTTFAAAVRRRPGRSVLIAAGTGYVVGGGIGTVLTARLLGLFTRVALRLALVPIIATGVERALYGSGNEAGGASNGKSSRGSGNGNHRKEATS